MKEPIMYPYKIEISGSRSDDDQFWRVQRLHRVLAYAQALADIDNNINWHKCISSLYDYKGILTVRLRFYVYDNVREYLQKAWESIVTDNESADIIFEMVKKKHAVRLKNIVALNIPVNDLNDLIELLRDQGISEIDVETNNPFDNLTDTIKSDLPIDDIDKDFFKRLIAIKNSCTIVPSKRIENINY